MYYGIVIAFNISDNTIKICNYDFALLVLDFNVVQPYFFRMVVFGV